MTKGSGRRIKTLPEEAKAKVIEARVQIRRLRRAATEKGEDIADALKVQEEIIAQQFNAAVTGIDTDETAAVDAVRRLARTARMGVAAEQEVVVSHLYTLTQAVLPHK